jgi:3-oxoacyl-[acyl-carrier-protein] synthase-1
VEYPVVTGFGMVASLGYDARTCCAAARAGLVRPFMLDALKVPTPVEGEPAPTIGHAASLLTRGFEGDARLVRLLQGVLTDLSAHAYTQAQGVRSGFYLSLPDPRRIYGGLELIPSEATRKEKEKEAADADDEPDVERPSRLLAQAAELARWRGTPQVRGVVTSGHAGGIEALNAASLDLAAGSIDVAIVLGVDSLLDEDTLYWLQATYRLKTAANPVGLPPGEAAAAILIETTAGAQARQRPTIANVLNVTVGAEAQSLLSGAPPVGSELARVLAAAGELAGWRDETPAWLVVDHNGETYRAAEWGHAVVRLRGEYAAVANAKLWYPAAALGDTGAASSVVGMCVALAAIERGYNAAPCCVISATSEAEPRAVAVLAAPQGARH